MMKTVYLFSEQTGEYVGPYESQPSPLEPGEYLTPVSCLGQPPPVLGVNEVAVAVAGGWFVKPDFRRAKLLSTVTGQPVIVTAIGPQPVDTTDLPRPSVHHDWGGAVWVLNIVAAKAEVAAAESIAAKTELANLDLQSIQFIREYIAAKADAPAVLKAYEAQAVVARAKVKK